MALPGLFGVRQISSSVPRSSSLVRLSRALCLILPLPTRGYPCSERITSTTSTTADGSATAPETADGASGVAEPQVSRRHHYVPAFLLGGFTPTGRQSDALWVFDNECAAPESRTPRAVAFERDYYTVDVPGQPPDFIENYFSRVETTAARIIREMLANRAMPTGDDYSDFMLFLALMRGRSPSFREALKQFYEDRMHDRVKIAASSREAYEAAFRDYPQDKRSRPLRWCRSGPVRRSLSRSPTRAQCTCRRRWSPSTTRPWPSSKHELGRWFLPVATCHSSVLTTQSRLSIWKRQPELSSRRGSPSWKRISRCRSIGRRP